MTTTLHTHLGHQDHSACQLTATAFLSTLAGSTLADLRWDDTHRLQGHATCDGHALVVIASHDAERSAVVMTLADWESVRRCDADDRVRLLRACVIDNHERFLEMLAAS